MDCEDHFLTIHFFAFTLFFRPSQPFLPAVPAFRFQAANNSRSVFPALRFPSVPEHCRTTEGKIAFLFAALYTSRRSGIFIDNLSDHHRADLHLQQCAEICGLQQRVGSRIFFIDRAKIIRRRIDRVEYALNPPFRRTDAVIHKEIPVIIVHGKPKQK